MLQRELPVFGFVEGRLVFGVIDEVKLHHDKTAASGSSLAKKYSSQEEWKKKSSQQKKKAKQDSSQKSLAAFLPGVKTLVEDRIDQEDKKGNGIYGFILEDAKTRLSMSMPEEKDQTQSKLQCMVYKRLLEGLILGMANNTKGAKLDEYTTPVTPELLCLYLDLESAVPFSDAFMSDASELCEGFNLPIKVVQQEDRSWSCNLMHLFALLSITLDDFVKMAREGTVNKDDYFVIQNELRLTYRRRGAKLSNSERTRSRTKEPRQHNRRVQPSRRALSTPAPGATSILDLLQGNKSVEDLDEEAQVDMALQMSLDDASKEEEEELLADTTVAMPSTPQKSSKSRDTIIGTVRFEHDAQQLQEHLIDVMAMWQGKRALRGVKVDQTWRCNHCEYQTGCEWRQMKADESLQRSLEKRQAQEDLAMWSQLDDLPDEMEW
jgi:exonuclease V